jgi:hypothetical protein
MNFQRSTANEYSYSGKHEIRKPVSKSWPREMLVPDELTTKNGCAQHSGEIPRFIFLRW